MYIIHSLSLSLSLSLSTFKFDIVIIGDCVSLLYCVSIMVVVCFWASMVI